MDEPLVVRREVQIAAPPSTVFAFLTDPEKILRWMGTDATVEPHPGGLYLVNVTAKDVARGRFTEVIPVHRLAYSFGWDNRENMPPAPSPPASARPSPSTRPRRRCLRGPCEGLGLLPGKTGRSRRGPRSRPRHAAQLSARARG